MAGRGNLQILYLEGERRQISYQHLSIARARSTNITSHQQRTSISNSSDNFLFKVLPFFSSACLSHLIFLFLPTALWSCGLVIPNLLSTCGCGFTYVFVFSSLSSFSLHDYCGLVVWLCFSSNPLYYPVRHHTHTDSCHRQIQRQPPPGCITDSTKLNRSVEKMSRKVL